MRKGYVVILCAAVYVAALWATFALASDYARHHKNHTLRSYFQPDNPSWRGAQLTGGVVCWQLLDTAKDPKWSADYCSR